jgi:hypothetical protein
VAGSTIRYWVPPPGCSNQGVIGAFFRFAREARPPLPHGRHIQFMGACDSHTAANLLRSLRLTRIDASFDLFVQGLRPIPGSSQRSRREVAEEGERVPQR